MMTCSRLGRIVLAAAALFIGQASLQAEEGPRRYDGYRVVQVEVRSLDELARLESQVETILNCHPGVGPMDVLVSPVQWDALSATEANLRVLQDDVQKEIDRERAATEAHRGGDVFDDFFLAYRPYGSASEEGSIVWYMNELVSRYPTLASMVNIGTTVQGRTIWGLKIHSGVATDPPGVFYFGAEHAREWVTTTTPNYVAHHLVSNYGVIPEVTDLVDNVEFYLIPVHNVDGYIYTWTSERFWRKNRRFNGGTSFGVDLNRNWAQGWGGTGSSGSTTSDIYRGPSPFSEPETQAFRDFLLANPNIRAQLDIHSYTQLLLWPYGYTNSLPADQADYADIGFAMRDLIFGVHGQNYVAGPVYSTIYPASGVSVDWTYDQLGLLSMSFELRPTCCGLAGFDLPASQIIPTNEEVLPAILHMTNSDWVRQPAPVSPPVVTTAGARYISIGLDSGYAEASIEITSPEHPCLSKFVTAAGYLGVAPDMQPSGDWGTILVGDQDILPNTTYAVRAHYGAEGTSDFVSVTTAAWGDVVAPFGVVDIKDISALVLAFQNDPDAPALSWADQTPVVPDRIIDITDIAASVNAFQGMSYPHGLVDPCP